MRNIRQYKVKNDKEVVFTGIYPGDLIYDDDKEESWVVDLRKSYTMGDRALASLIKDGYVIPCSACGSGSGSVAAPIMSHHANFAPATISEAERDFFLLSLTNENFKNAHDPSNKAAITVEIDGNIIHPIDVLFSNHDMKIELPYAVDAQDIVTVIYDGTGTLEGVQSGKIGAMSALNVVNSITSTSPIAVNSRTVFGEPRHLYIDFNGPVDCNDPAGFSYENHTIVDVGNKDPDTLIIYLGEDQIVGAHPEFLYDGLGYARTHNTTYGIKPI